MLEYTPLFNGKKIANCEILSFDHDTMVGLAKFYGALVRFEGRIVEGDSRALEYAKLDVKVLDSNHIELVDKCE